MVSQNSSELSPFLMMYGQEAIMPEENPNLTYLSKENYKIEVENHIGRMIAISQNLREKPQESTRRSKERFGRNMLRKISPLFCFKNCIDKYKDKNQNL